MTRLYDCGVMTRRRTEFLHEKCGKNQKLCRVGIEFSVVTNIVITIPKPFVNNSLHVSV